MTFLIFFSSKGQENKVRVDTSQGGEGALSVNIRYSSSKNIFNLKVLRFCNMSLF